MRKKIAVIYGWYNFGEHKGINEDNRLMTNCFYESAKKHFLPHHDVELIFMTNSDVSFDGVTNIHFEYKVSCYSEMLLMKIMSLRFLKDEYDYIFVNDNDQVYIKDVGDEILESDFIFVDHFFPSPVEAVHKEVTDIVELNFNTSDEKWTMGNFFGGKQRNMMELLNIAEENHKKYFGHNYDGLQFYSRYPDELFILKYVYENNVNHKRMNTCVHPLQSPGEYFLSDWGDDDSVPFEVTNVNLLHNTKKNLNKLRKLYERK